MLEIDSKLVKFKSEVGSNISTIKNNKDKLSDDINSFSQYNTSSISSVSSSFKGSVSSSVTTEVEYLNQTLNKIKNSLDSEFGAVIDECVKLDNGITELEGLKKTYEDVERSYNNTTDESKKSNMLYSVNSAKKAFTDKQELLLNDYQSLLDKDSSLNILKDYGVNDSTLNDVVSNLTPGISFSSIYYEKDGVIYQKVVPICGNNTPYVMDEDYIIAYNKEAILKAAEASGNRTIGEEVINFVASKMNGTNQNQYLYDYCADKYKYKEKDTKVIGAVMDQILNDTYVVMGCKSISDYAVVSGVTINSSIIHLGYGGAGDNTWSKGITNVLNSCGKLECSGLTRWSYAQGVHNYYKDSNLDFKQVKSMAGKTTPGAFLWNCSAKFTEMSAEEMMNLKPGCLVSKEVPNNIHIGMLVGHTKVNGEDALVFVQSSNTTIGVNFRTATVSELKSGRSWASVSTPERSAGVFTENLTVKA